MQEIHKRINASFGDTAATVFYAGDPKMLYVHRSFWDNLSLRTDLFPPPEQHLLVADKETGDISIHQAMSVFDVLRSLREVTNYYAYTDYIPAEKIEFLVSILNYLIDMEETFTLSAYRFCHDVISKNGLQLISAIDIPMPEEDTSCKKQSWLKKIFRK